jgi:hypothetical protein
MSTQPIPPAPAPIRPRRRSIFTGVLLITVGVLFLLRNFGWHYQLWWAIGRWWPVLLILWGLSKLYDHMVAQRTGQAPPRTVTGGEVILVFLALAVLGGGSWFHDHPENFGWDWGDGDAVPWAHTYTYNE